MSLSGLTTYFQMAANIVAATNIVVAVVEAVLDWLS
jgi:hypothetical protein